jgi:hypothetical protein
MPRNPKFGGTLPKRPKPDRAFALAARRAKDAQRLVKNQKRKIAVLTSELGKAAVRAVREKTYTLRTIADLRWAIHDLFVYFENHKDGYTHAEAARIEEIRKMAPPHAITTGCAVGLTPPAGPSPEAIARAKADLAARIPAGKP